MMLITARLKAGTTRCRPPPTWHGRTEARLENAGLRDADTDTDTGTAHLKARRRRHYAMRTGTDAGTAH